MTSNSDRKIIFSKDFSSQKIIPKQFRRQRITRRFHPKQATLTMMFNVEKVNIEKEEQLNNILENNTSEKIQSQRILHKNREEMKINESRNNFYHDHQYSEQMLNEDNKRLIHSNEQSRSNKMIDNSLDFSDKNQESMNQMRKRKDQIYKNCSYIQNRKSYRKGLKKKIKTFIPYRKNQSQLQLKIVSTINKMLNGKDCHKQLQRLIQHKLQTKQFMSQYIVSGFNAIYHLATQSKLYDSKLLKNINIFINNLTEIIEIQLDDGQQYDQQLQQEEILDRKIFQMFLARKIYHILKKKYQDNRDILQKRSVELCKEFIVQNGMKIQKIIKLLQKLQSKQKQNFILQG